ncbi:cation-translocating P-type ATPase [Wenzhouxiangella sediminis]|uniref:HAD family hydrolase n=1 Tax=Wenzhouxiangella sediminis TaxID=1792836 RepID=A0A3E1K8I7_9GAMM|nr:HAD-IC family P-type ATPase [Wenzhouxiangella sediminis]RFF30401.1 HAD family hydrolase [Wenzhouxiangella sediminis]
MADWHALGVDETLHKLESSPRGLDDSEVERRQAEFGPNRLPGQAGRPWWRRLAAQFHDVLIYVLIAAAALSALTDHWVDAAVIAAVVIINALVGLVQEGKAERAMEAIGRMLALRARVRRGDRPVTVPAASLVPGDIVALQAGDRVPADMRLIESHGLRIDQAALTGESVPVGRQTEPVAANTDLAERRSMVWSGTMVVGGQAIGVVTGIGRDTELGRISTLLEQVEPLSTPLVRQMNRFGRRLTGLLLALTTAIIALGVGLHDMGLGEGFLAGVALVVSAIPEGLPAIMTVTLAIGVQRMAARKAIVRRLPAVETLGAVTVICSDKTGTLTGNELRARELITAEGSIAPGQLPGAGETFRRLVEAALLCNDAEQGSDHNDPIEAALLGLAEPAGIDLAALRRKRPRTGLLPFSSERKLMASAHGQTLTVKGAPERILSLCESTATASGSMPLDAAGWHERLDGLAEKGLRVLAVAAGKSDGAGAALDESRLSDAGLRLLGLVAFSDPPRAEVPEAVAACRRAGIQVKMITGDHAATARAVAEELGMAGDQPPVTGQELERLDERALAERVRVSHVFARTAPEHKLRLVEALQANSEVVAMTGDGANDAPALKRADIGVAMGIKGTEASRQAAAMVLADDNFASIAAGVEEGRGVYANIRKSLLFILPTNAAEYIVVSLAVLAGMALPVTPVHILWINMVTTVTLALALAFEPAEEDAMRQPPRPPGEGLINRFVAIRIVWFGLVLMAATSGLFHWEMAASGEELLARTLAVNMLVAGEAIYLFNCRQLLAPGFTPGTLGTNPVALAAIGALIVLQLGFTYLPAAAEVFGTAPLSARHWLTIAALALPIAALVELEKALWRASLGRRREPIESQIDNRTDA